MKNKTKFGKVWVFIALVLLFVPVVTAECNDNSDNDGDGLVDTSDPGCVSSDDASEMAYGLQLFYDQNYEDACAAMLNDKLVGYDCVEDNYQTMAWKVAYNNPTRGLQICLATYLGDYYNLLYDADITYTKIALADCVYQHATEFESSIKKAFKDLVSSEDIYGVGSYCLQVHYSDYSAECEEEETQNLDSDVGCTQHTDCESTAACVLDENDSLYQTCVTCVDSDGDDPYTGQAGSYGVEQTTSYSYASDRNDYCNSDTELIERYCSAGDNSFIAAKGVDCTSFSMVCDEDIDGIGACVKEAEEVTDTTDDSLIGIDLEVVSAGDGELRSDGEIGLETFDVCVINNGAENFTDNFRVLIEGVTYNDDSSMVVSGVNLTSGDVCTDLSSFFGGIEIGDTDEELIFDVTVDPNDDVIEDNENNNVLTVSIKNPNYVVQDESEPCVGPDTDCVSPLDTDESGSGPSYGAAGVEESFLSKVWNWLTFWN
jgi:hypothetical protein